MLVATAAIVAITTSTELDRHCNIPVVNYSISYEGGNFACGVASVEHFNAWIAAGLSIDFDQTDAAMVAGLATVGLVEGDEGELMLAPGWTWDMHDAAVAVAKN